MRHFFAALSVCGAIVVSAFFGCNDPVQAVKDYFRTPDLKPVRSVLNATMPIGYAANLTMAALNGTKYPNVSIARTGDSSIGTFAGYIDVDGNFPLPGTVRAQGRILVGGMVVRNNMVLMTALFTKMSIISGTFTINAIRAFPVVLDTDFITGRPRCIAVYADVDVGIGQPDPGDTVVAVNFSDSTVQAKFGMFDRMKTLDSSAARDTLIFVKENAWIIEISDNNTKQDASDDTFYVTGGGQYVEAGTATMGFTQMTMLQTAMTPACKLNPVSGWGFMQTVKDTLSAASGSNELGQIVLRFHSQHDGTVDIMAGTGNYLLATGKKVPLQLGQ